jgi:putative membrane protein
LFGQATEVPHPQWWPAEGEEPDPRWSLANERTLLAYSRTALALVVAGLAIAGSHRIADLPVWVAILGLPVIALGGAVAIVGRRRYIEIQRAMRLGEPLRAPTAASLLPFGIGLFAIAGFVIVAIELARS